MNDYISRDAAIEASRTCFDTETFEDKANGGYYINYEDAVGMIEELPAADVPDTNVGKCRDCRNSDFSGKKSIYCLKHGVYMNNDDFCSSWQKDVE